MTTAPTDRERAKSRRQADLIAAAARLFAERGFTGVSLEEIGAAVGVSGPAVYRHFASKQALLAAILVGVSEHLLQGGEAVVAAEGDATSGLKALIRFHVDFALTDADVIRVQDRDLTSLADTERHRVRRLQREYVELWVGVLRGIHSSRTDANLRVRAHAVFGLINSTPHSVRGLRAVPAENEVREVLEQLAWAALTI
ncbi:TetR/AcrR family transcriptional regulator [Microbacterium protaetiae]|uniref:TetR/AcrR family transcriptional regulator n=1 Tax=Microbacterium protaetiae TaxID=2509458 RepID=A0A4P6EMM3_9MICO|nr:TetR/AcrR family transcriptional regulator [Microbacterium protaetiae]QAY61497.1 TetR/AcrR family transcriptional regulator [Microbacterium protaetiae]